MIKTIIRLRHDMVMVFDDEGEQVPKYQGQYQDVKTSILRDAPLDAVFARWVNCDTEPEAVCRERW